jgi:hypothetical protein
MMLKHIEVIRSHDAQAHQGVVRVSRSSYTYTFTQSTPSFIHTNTYTHIHAYIHTRLWSLVTRKPLSGRVR